jgi:hypothetical protein
MSMTRKVSGFISVRQQPFGRTATSPSLLKAAPLTGGTGAETLLHISGASLPASDSVVFEPIIPGTETLIGFSIIIFFSIVATWVWANQVVPVSRTKLAISKSRGEVKEYLDELKESDTTFANESVTEATIDGAVVSATEVESINNDRVFERWLFTDWLQDNKSDRKAGRQKEPALPILKDAKWNSGDNPVLVASALLGAGVMFSAVTERVASSNFGF